MRALVVVAGLGLVALTAVALQFRRDMPEIASTEDLQVCGSTVQVKFAVGDLDLPHSDVLQWVRNAGESVGTYFGRLPMKSMTVMVVPRADRHGVLNGETWGGPSVRTRMGLGQHTSVAELNEDWTMTHELVHTAFPDLAEEHHWVEEGLAVYVEPVARTQHGLLSQEQVWADMIHDMPKGEPEADDQGLDHTHTWARTYWGGAMFFLAADVGIREQTKNRKGLQDALRAIMESGAIDVDSTPEKAFAVGDKTVGAPVLEVLYAAMRDKPTPVDLDALWRKLGVKAKAGGGVTYDDKAPDAAIRKAIFAARPGCKAGS